MKCLNCDNDARKESGLCSACEEQEQQKINGILYLPALGIILSVITTPFSLYDIINSMIIHFKNTGFLGYYALALVFFLFAMFALEIFAAISFFQRKKRTRNVMVAYYLFSALLVGYMTLLPAYLFNVKLDIGDIRAIASSVFGIVVWIPYFLLSKRVPLVFSR
ncbi:DUF2569 domain-containing protein [Pectobacterium carotovorum]|uniref:DUF2569 domain-containing protein n=1 Tax=Pectobacterium carotovorum TaxID=554 RepID=UPI002084587D|nr:DUF2569 domain-containing protein [Pectobacterium carotovorum]GKW36381.1 hypothetical protein PEC301875_04050 [Pectobacterium carotovorum subsp. carotovorum]